MDIRTVGDHLDAWLELHRSQVQPSTWEEYEGVVRRYLRPHLGNLGLDEITHHDVTRLYHSLLTSGGVRGKPLALVTVRRIAAVAHKSFADAERTDILAANPCDKATIPRVSLKDGPRDLKVWSAENLAAFLEYERGRPLWALWVVAVGTGMRRGELLGLRWVDVDLDKAVIHVRRALSEVNGIARLKVPKSNRARSLHVGRAVVEALKLRRADQLREAESVPPPGAAEPPDSRSWGLVFTEPDGGHIRPHKVTSTWRRAVRAAPVPVIRFHDARHAHATLLLAAGVSPQIVSARLGHASIKTTLDIYASVLPAMDQDAAALFETHVWDQVWKEPPRAPDQAGVLESPPYRERVRRRMPPAREDEAP